MYISYEKKYMEELKTKAEQKQKDSSKENTTAPAATTAGAKETKSQSKTSTSSNTEHDLDMFLLGDLGSDDDGPGRRFTISYVLSLIHHKHKKRRQYKHFIFH